MIGDSTLTQDRSGQVITIFQGMLCNAVGIWKLTHHGEVQIDWKREENPGTL